MIDLSILVCSVHTRYKTFAPKIQEQIWSQYNALPKKDQDRIEILMLTDNKQRMLGEKRNNLVNLSQGRYVQFIDDDDKIAPDMFSSILSAIDKSDADVITFLAGVSMNGGPYHTCRYSKEYGIDYNTEKEYRRIPNHICCVKRELVEAVKFKNVVYGEDADYSQRLISHLKTEYQIPKMLYYYDYNRETSEQQEFIHHNKKNAEVDVVILSNAKTQELFDMTNNCLNSLFASITDVDINVFVVEQQKKINYKNAVTIHPFGSFNYNRFANEGVEIGEADWFVVANNDLTFEPGWLSELLAVKHPVMSPCNPNSPVQTRHKKNVTGYENGEHFSGWCFMMKGSVWEDLGGFDESVTFWCSDNAVVEQLRAVGIEPMLVRNSIVRHTASQTLKTTNDFYGLTYANVKIFNEKYNQNLFADDAHYQKWLSEQPKQSIGIGITTHNRREDYLKTLEEMKKYLPAEARLVIVDDGSAVPAPGATFRFEEPQGIAVAKNKCLELLEGCEHIFLFDDDTYPTEHGWEKDYINSPEPHLMYLFKSNPRDPNHVVYQDDTYHEWFSPCGCMLYFHKSVLDRVGGFDPVYGKWGCEHGDLSSRIFNAKLTSRRYIGLKDTKIYCMDQVFGHQRTVSDEEIMKFWQKNVPIATERFEKGDSRYIEYRTKV